MQDDHKYLPSIGIMSNPVLPNTKITPRNIALGTVCAFIGGVSIWIKANSEGKLGNIISNREYF